MFSKTIISALAVLHLADNVNGVGLRCTYADDECELCLQRTVTYSEFKRNTESIKLLITVRVPYWSILSCFFSFFSFAGKTLVLCSYIAEEYNDDGVNTTNCATLFQSLKDEYDSDEMCPNSDDKCVEDFNDYYSAENMEARFNACKFRRRGVCGDDAKNAADELLTAAKKAYEDGGCGGGGGGGDCDALKKQLDDAQAMAAEAGEYSTADIPDSSTLNDGDIAAIAIGTPALLAACALAWCFRTKQGFFGSSSGMAEPIKF